MSTEFQARVERIPGTMAARFSLDVAEHALAERLGPDIIRQFAIDVEKQLVERWIAARGEEVLKSLSADAVALAVKKHIEERVAKILLSGRV